MPVTTSKGLIFLSNETTGSFYHARFWCFDGICWKNISTFKVLRKKILKLGHLHDNWVPPSVVEDPVIRLISTQRPSRLDCFCQKCGITPAFKSSADTVTMQLASTFSQLYFILSESQHGVYSRATEYISFHSFHHIDLVNQTFIRSPIQSEWTWWWLILHPFT